MTVIQLASEHPILAFAITVIAMHIPFKIWNRFMRHLNIRAHGWPPPHCDADGAFKAEEKD